MPAGRFDIPDLVLKLLDEGMGVGAYPFEGYWLDIGRHDDYDQAVAEFKDDPAPAAAGRGVLLAPWAAGLGRWPGRAAAGPCSGGGLGARSPASRWATAQTPPRAALRRYCWGSAGWLRAGLDDGDLRAEMPPAVTARGWGGGPAATLRRGGGVPGQAGLTGAGRGSGRR